MGIRIKTNDLIELLQDENKSLDHRFELGCQVVIAVDNFLDRNRYNEKKPNQIDLSRQIKLGDLFLKCANQTKIKNFKEKIRFFQIGTLETAKYIYESISYFFYSTTPKETKEEARERKKEIKLELIKEITKLCYQGLPKNRKKNNLTYDLLQESLQTAENVNSTFLAEFFRKLKFKKFEVVGNSNYKCKPN